MFGSSSLSMFDLGSRIKNWDEVASKLSKSIIPKDASLKFESIEESSHISLLDIAPAN